VIAVSAAGAVAGVLGVFVVVFVVWVVVMGRVDARQAAREERAMRERWGVSS
jgi:O-antigen ligase